MRLYFTLTLALALVPESILHLIPLSPAARSLVILRDLTTQKLKLRPRARMNHTDPRGWAWVMHEDCGLWIVRRRPGLKSMEGEVGIVEVKGEGEVEKCK